MIDVHEILNGTRDYQNYEPTPESPETLENIEEGAREGMFNAPAANELILRLLEIIKLLRSGDTIA